MLETLRDPDRRFSVAPMMDWTDRHDRYFLRLITRRALLYTEMVPTGAITHGDRQRFLTFDPAEHPVALQLGGADPEALKISAKAGEDFGYDEINLNVGCPSDRVQKARFGACLMAEPDLVAESLAAMAAAVSIPVTVKTRIGIDNEDSYAFLQTFVEKVRAVGCRTVIVHARKAWLKGLSPKQNREIPPLDYPRVYKLKKDFPDLEIVINGGINDLNLAEEQLQKVDGVMLGRLAYKDPFALSTVDHRFFGDDRPSLSRIEVAEAMVEYVARRMGEGVPLKSITRHILGLYNGQPGGRLWRRLLSERAHLPDAKPDLLLEAAEEVETLRRAA